jgi:hypothetical protein
MTALYEERTAPEGTASNMPITASHSSADRLVTLGLACAELIDEMAAKAAEDERRDNATFRFAYHLGFSAGAEIGYRRRVAEEDAAAKAFADEIRGRVTGPLAEELHRRRYPGYTHERLRELRAAARARFGLPGGGR